MPGKNNNNKNEKFKNEYIQKSTSRLFLLLIPKAKKLKNENGRSSDLLPLLNAFPMWLIC